MLQSDNAGTGTELSGSLNAGLIPSRLTEYKEAFALFDKKGTGAVQREVLGDLLRALGQNPTQAEVAEIISGAPREGAFAPSKSGNISLTLMRVVIHWCCCSILWCKYYDDAQWTIRPS